MQEAPTYHSNPRTDNLNFRAVLLSVFAPMLGGFISGGIVAANQVGLITVIGGIAFYGCMLWGLTLITTVFTGPWWGPSIVKRRSFLWLFSFFHVGTSLMVMFAAAPQMWSGPDPRFQVLFKIIGFPIFFICKYIHQVLNLAPYISKPVAELFYLPLLLSNSVLWAWLIWTICRRAIPQVFRD